MNKFIIILIFSGILLSGCIGNPLEEVPVVNVNITYIDNQGFVEAIAYDFTPGNVSFLNRPQREHAAFPAISGRTMISDEENSIIGEWEMLPYTGPGTYSFNIGFNENKYPITNDIVHISIYVINEKGDRIGFVTKNIVWK